jgi:hypothetical protein
MKKYRVFLWAALVGALLASCGMQGEGSLVVDFPPIPAGWSELLGPPRWLIHYYSRDGREQTLDSGGAPVELPLSPTRISPVFAWPYWPGQGIKAGDFRPAGAIIPYDTHDPVRLSWQGGLEAWFYQLLDTAGDGTADTAGRRGGTFNWPGFRALFSDPSVAQKIQDDPWCADWETIAAKTIQSGFRKQWLVPAATTSLSIPASPGPWISPSPFPPARIFDGPPVFEVGPEIQSWYSAAGILHCAGTSWLLLPW